MTQSVTEKRRDNTALRCAVSGRCGGCSYSGVSYSGQLREKQARAERLLKEFGPVSPIRGMDDPLYYRNKVHAAFGTQKSGKVLCGRYKEGTHEIIEAGNCLLENEQAQKIIQDIRDLVVSFRIPVYNEVSRRGCFRRVLIRTARVTGQIMVVLVLGSPVFVSRGNFVQALRVLHPEITTIVQNINTRRDSMILGERSQVLYGRGYIEDELCGLTYRISPESFYQVNSVQAQKLYEKAIEMAQLTKRERVIDAYCGIGTIGMTAASKAAEVTGIELNSSAVRDAVSNAKRSHVENIRFVCADATEYLTRSARAGGTADVILMDPPRAGSTPAFIRAASSMKPDRIVYISCNPVTLARDLKLFVKQNYIPREIAPFDMFPFTQDIETAVLLERRGRSQGMKPGRDNHNES